MASWGALVEFRDLIAASGGPSETVTPMRFATVIRRGASGAREASRMRWGLIPPWTQDANGSPLIHARAETIETKPSFREAFFHRRGLVVVTTFNEGKEITPRKTEQHRIAPDDGMPLAIAVIWERWDDRLETFAMVTVPANALIGTITDRMPAILAPADWAAWLGETPAGIDALKAMLRPFEGDWTMQTEARRARTPARQADQPPLF